jgi:uncharacterized YccA/Bax inhibitor family protein
MNNRFTNSNNPIIGEKALERNRQAGDYADGTMSVTGADDKSLILACILLFMAIVGYSMANPMMMIGGAVVGLILVIFSVFKPQYSGITAPAYAVFEGLFVGSLTAMYANAYDGIVFQAVSLTIAILFGMLFLYKSGIVRVTPQFRTGVIMATFGIFAVYMLSWVLSFFGITVPYLHQGGMMGIGISLAIIGVASLNLLLDFDNFDRGEEMGLPKYYEWFFGMGLMITLVWLYVEILRLLSILNRD